MNCVCDKWSTMPCESAPTQEDLKCDVCRNGCGGAIGLGHKILRFHVAKVAVSW